MVTVMAHFELDPPQTKWLDLSDGSGCLIISNLTQTIDLFISKEQYHKWITEQYAAMLIEKIPKQNDEGEF